VTTRDDIANKGARKYHKGVMELSCEALEEQPVDIREYQSFSMTVDRDKIPLSKEMIRNFRAQLELACRSEAGNEIANGAGNGGGAPGCAAKPQATSDGSRLSIFSRPKTSSACRSLSIRGKRKTSSISCNSGFSVPTGTYTNDILRQIDDSLYKLEPSPSRCPGGTIKYKQVVNYKADGLILVQRELFNSLSIKQSKDALSDLGESEVGIPMKFVQIHPGPFTMGADFGNSFPNPVQLTRGFEIQATEVTQLQ
jgi:hypothetical protein